MAEDSVVEFSIQDIISNDDANQKYLICSDSMTALIEVTIFTTHQVIRNIQEWKQLQDDNNSQGNVLWVSFHSGI